MTVALKRLGWVFLGLLAGGLAASGQTSPLTLSALLQQEASQTAAAFTALLAQPAIAALAVACENIGIETPINKVSNMRGSVNRVYLRMCRYRDRSVKRRPDRRTSDRHQQRNRRNQDCDDEFRRRIPL